jgi:hypothetical protein
MYRQFVNILFALLLTARCCSAAEPAGSSSADVSQKSPGTTSPDKSPSNNATDQAATHDNSAGKEISPALRSLFERLDKLGRDKIKDAQFITINFVDVGESARQSTANAWLINRDANSVVLMQDDLIPWKYNNKSVTTMPSSWGPRSTQIESISDADFKSVCEKLSKSDSQSAPRVIAVPFNAIGPSYRALVAHAAWKKGESQLCEAIVSADPQYKLGLEAYQAAVFEDLAWLHFLRGVNLLMFADRSEVIPHMQLVIELSPNGEFAKQAKDLIPRLEKLIADEKNPKKDVDESKLSDSELAEFYASRLKDLRCPQLSQPGSIIPYLGIVAGKPDAKPPTVKLKEMGMRAVPSLIKGLEDDTPTRTVYFWRDFHRSRVVWRVSDFSWSILRDITNMQLGKRNSVGHTLSSMSAEEKARTIESIKRWYNTNKNLSVDDRMFQLLSGRNREDWITAGKYFLKQKNKRAVKPLLEKLSTAGPFGTGELCEIVAGFGDPTAKEPLRNVMTSRREPADQISAAIALYELGDPSGIPMAIEFVSAKTQAYGSWDVPIWFLMKAKSKEGMEALRKVVAEAPATRAAEVCYAISKSITGMMSGNEREPAGCLEVCPVLIAAMRRDDYTGGTMNGSRTRVKDIAAEGFCLLRDGFTSRFAHADPKSFDTHEKSEQKRDAQIAALIEWYEKHEAKLDWNPKLRRLESKE